LIGILCTTDLLLGSKKKKEKKKKRERRIELNIITRKNRKTKTKTKTKKHLKKLHRYYFQGLVALPLLHFQYSDWPEAQTALTLIIKFLQPAIGNTPSVNYLQTKHRIKPLEIIRKDIM
jgi:hypothetical protein